MSTNNSMNKKIAIGWQNAYPNIDEQVAKAKLELNRHGSWEYASGKAYSDGKAAFNKLEYLLSIKKIIDEIPYL